MLSRRGCGLSLLPGSSSACCLSPSTSWPAAGPAARLWLGDDARPIIDMDAGQIASESASDAVDLRAGQLYDLRLEVRQMSDPAVVELRCSGDGTPKDLIPPANLYPTSIVDAFVTTFILLHKVTLIVNGCELTARESSVASLQPHPNRRRLPAEDHQRPLSSLM